MPPERTQTHKHRKCTGFLLWLNAIYRFAAEEKWGGGGSSWGFVLYMYIHALRTRTHIRIIMFSTVYYIEGCHLKYILDVRVQRRNWYWPLPTLSSSSHAAVQLSYSFVELKIVECECVCFGMGLSATSKIIKWNLCSFSWGRERKEKKFKTAWKPTNPYILQRIRIIYTSICSNERILPTQMIFKNSIEVRSNTHNKFLSYTTVNNNCLHNYVPNSKCVIHPSVGNPKSHISESWYSFFNQNHQNAQKKNKNIIR